MEEGRALLKIQPIFGAAKRANCLEEPDAGEDRCFQRIGWLLQVGFQGITAEVQATTDDAKEEGQ